MAAEMDHPDDDRPWGWGCCAECGHDCEEDDYMPNARISLHLACAEKRRTRLSFYAAAEAYGLTDEELECYVLKGML